MDTVCHLYFQPCERRHNHDKSLKYILEMQLSLRYLQKLRHQFSIHRKISLLDEFMVV